MSTKGIKVVPEYEKFEYDRAYVTKAEILDLINDVLDFKQSDVSKVVFDGKVTPVVVLNDTKNFNNWSLLWTFSTGWADSCRDLLVDNFGNVWFSFTAGKLLCYSKEQVQLVNHNVVGRYAGLQVNSRFGPPYFDGYGFSKTGRYVAIWVDSESGEANDWLMVYDYGVKVFEKKLRSLDANYHDLVGGVRVSPNGKYIALSSTQGAGADINYIWLFEGEYI